MHEVLLYGEIFSFTASAFIKDINEVPEDGELFVKINTEGGSVADAFGMIAKYKEFPGTKRTRIDGQAMSMGFYWACYVEDVECLDVTQFMIHRASMHAWTEGHEDFETSGLKGYLESINKDLKKAFTAKVDVKLFEEISGVTVNEIFSMEGTKDVFLTASQAKKIGLISKVTKLTLAKTQKIEAAMAKVAATYNGGTPIAKKVEKIIEEKNIDMDLNKLKTDHPGLYSQVVAIGVEEGVKTGTTTERDRVGAWLKWSHVDAKAVADGIEGGKTMSMTQISDFQVKMATPGAMAKLEKENAVNLGNQNPEGEDGADGELSEKEKVQAKIDKELGKPEKKPEKTA